MTATSQSAQASSNSTTASAHSDRSPLYLSLSSTTSRSNRLAATPFLFRKRLASSKQSSTHVSCFFLSQTVGKTYECRTGDCSQTALPRTDVRPYSPEQRASYLQHSGMRYPIPLTGCYSTSGSSVLLYIMLLLRSTRSRPLQTYTP